MFQFVYWQGRKLERTRRVAKRNHIKGNYLIAASKISHAINRLNERYGDVNYDKLRNYILKSRQFEVLDEDELGAICQTRFEGRDIYFVMHERYRGEEIATFLTQEMAEDALIEKQLRDEI